MTTNSINLAALGFGGIDTSTLVTSLVNVEQQPINQLAVQQQQLQAASSTISSFSSTLSALKTASVALSDPASFQAMKASSSDASIVSTATGSPAAGQWTVSVSHIATAQRTESNPATAADTALGLSGTLNLYIGPTTGGAKPTPVSISS